jgi:hypothetical protein
MASWPLKQSLAISDMVSRENWLIDTDYGELNTYHLSFIFQLSHFYCLAALREFGEKEFNQSYSISVIVAISLAWHVDL